MENMKHTPNYSMLSAEELQQIEGGKVGINISINIPWGAFRDTLRGIGDGLFGHRRKY